MFRFYKIPKWLRSLYPKAIWEIETTKNEVFLTFDDGPTPEVTHWVMNELAKYNFKATFFCIGQNMDKHPEIIEAIKSNGHLLANHTYNHEKSLKTPFDNYLASIQKTEKLVGNTSFRPPYGRLKPSHYKKLIIHYPIVLWSLISYDYDQKVSAKTILNKLVKHTKPGYIIIFHDSQKAFPHLQKVLPPYLEYLAENSFQLNVLPNFKS